MYNYFCSLNPTYQALFAGIFTWLITLLGASIVFFFRKVNDKIMEMAMGLSAGIMLAASFFSLLKPAIEMANALKMKSYNVISIGFILGTIILLGFEKLYDQLSNKKNISVNNSKKRCALLVSSITLHNIPEGLVIGVSFGSLIYNIPGSSVIGSIILAFGIGIQNFPEGCAISLPLKKEGYSNMKSFFIGQLSAIVEPISAVIGSILVMKIKILLPYLLAFAAGAMIYVVVSSLIPESQKRKDNTYNTIATLLGFTIMMFLDVFLG